MFIELRKTFAWRLFVVCWVLCVLAAALPDECRACFHFCHRKERPKRYDLPRGGCSALLWIALADGPLSPETCPSATGWEGKFLFNAVPADEQGRRFCSYVWHDPKSPESRPSPADIATLQGRADLHGTVPRCGVVGTSADTLLESNREVLFRELRFQAGDTDMPFLAALAEESGPRNIHLSVLDTYPTSGSFPLPVLEEDEPVCATSHGHGIARIAEELICDGTADDLHICAAEVTTRLALPVIQPGIGALDELPRPGPTDCGRFGSPIDLAMAIHAEVHPFPPPDKKPDHLILNLSVGWDADLLHNGLGAVAPDGLNAEELAVYAALADAAKNDVLTIAAAGNSHGGQIPGNGPLLPAGWYVKPPKIKLSPAFLPDPTDPVIWSIGAIDRNGKRLANARPGAEPPLVAYGDHASVEFDGKSWTDPLTGSSVGAAVASSLAALAWYIQPDLHRTEVMALLESSGTPLGRSAESYRPLNTTAPQVRRLSVTSLLSRAWSPPKIHYPPIPDLINCASGTWVSSAVAAGKIYKCPGAQTTYGIPSSPLLQPLGQVPWVQTQPGANACPSCSLGGGGGAPFRMVQTSTQVDLKLEIPPEWDSNLTLSDLWLEAVDVKGKRTTVWIGTPIPELVAGGSLKVTNLPLPADLEAAVLIARVDVDGKNLSLRMPIYVDPEK